MARTERAGGASLTASGGQVAGRTSQATALVALAPPAPGGSQALPSGAPRASGSTRVLPGARSHAVAGAARAHRRALGATAKEGLWARILQVLLPAEVLFFSSA